MPRKDNFYNSSTNCANSDKTYKCWKSLRMRIMKDHHDLYLKLDGLLLVFVFETFSNKFINSFKLEPFRYISTPGYRWDVMKKFNGVRFKLIPYTEKYQFFESMIRGDISLIY